LVFVLVFVFVFVLVNFIRVEVFHEQGIRECGACGAIMDVLQTIQHSCPALG
jgi:hypothetical protein